MRWVYQRIRAVFDKSAARVEDVLAPQVDGEDGLATSNKLVRSPYSDRA